MSDSPNSLEATIADCESEKLHLSGAIQPFGALIHVDGVTGRVPHASANLESFIGVAAADLIGQPIDRTGWLTVDQLEGLIESGLLKEPGHVFHLPAIADSTAGRVDAHLIRGTSGILIEIEPCDLLTEVLALQQLQRPFFTPPRDETEVQERHGQLLRAVRSITGFDRVMLYRFREDWSGEVVAEETSGEMGSYLGLRFPASDIPAIARHLYFLNPARTIPDVDATPVAVLPAGSPPDLTWSDLRSVSPVHLEYMRNMGIRASFSVPMRVGGQLWGLVACHHLSPLRLSPDQRAACVTLTNAHALGLGSHLGARRLQTIDGLERRIDEALEAVAGHADLTAGIAANSERLLALMDAAGFVLAIGDTWTTTGQTPPQPALEVLDRWFVAQYPETTFVTENLPDILPASGIDASAIGAFAVKAKTGSVRLYWFRREEVSEIAWAGNPNKPMAENAGVSRLSPRRSFEKWIELRRGRCRPWGNEERLVAAKFRNLLMLWL